MLATFTICLKKVKAQITLFLQKPTMQKESGSTKVNLHSK